MIGAIHMDMDTARGVRHGTGLDQRTDDVLEIFDILILQDGGDNFAGIGTVVGVYDSSVTLDLCADATITHCLPGAPLPVSGPVGLVIGSDVASGRAVVTGNHLGGVLSGNTGQLDFNAEVLILDHAHCRPLHY